MATTLPRNDELADQLELLADLSELEGEDSFRVLAYRRAATRIRETGGPVAQLALDGKAKELSGIGKTIEEKIVQVVELGEMEALTKRKALVPRGGRQVHAPARARPEDRAPDLAGARRDDARRAEGGGRAGAAARARRASARRARRRSWRRSPRSRRIRASRGACSATGCPSCSSSSTELRAHPAAVKVSEAGSARRRRETFRDLDVIATSTDPPALIEHFTSRD